MKRLFVAMSVSSFIACSAVGAQAESKADKAMTESQQTAPTNTSKNRRDRKEQNPTAQDQSNDSADTAVVRNLRKAIMAQKGLSTDAQNVKIISEHGVLTLRGPVDTTREKQLIGSLAKSCCGVQEYSNQLEVKGHNSQK